MIKLIINSFLCFALIGPAVSKISESKIGADGWHLVIDLDDNRACEDKCLATNNSKKISNAFLNVLQQANHSYDALADLLFVEFVYGLADYNQWAQNIKQNDFEYEGYEKLQNLVNRYKVCQKVCKVYSQLRKALKKHAGDARMYENDNVDGSKEIEVNGEICILADMQDNLERFISQDRAYQKVSFNCQVFIADVNLNQAAWAGIDIDVKAEVTIVPLPFITWDVTASIGTYNKANIFRSL